MEIETWKQIIKKAIKSANESGPNEYKLLKNPEGNKWFIYDPTTMGKCKTCGHCRNEAKTIVITFHKPRDHLTIFEVGMLGKLYLENKLVGDYSRWEKCPYGKEFIENIDTVMEL